MISAGTSQVNPPPRLMVIRIRPIINALVFWGFASVRCHRSEQRLTMASSDDAVRAVLWTHLSCRRNARAVARLSRWDWFRSEPVDAGRDFGEQVREYRDLGLTRCPQWVQTQSFAGRRYHQPLRDVVRHGASHRKARLAKCRYVRLQSGGIPIELGLSPRCDREIGSRLQ